MLGIAAALLNPFLTAGLYSCIVARQRGTTVSFGMLFQPLKEPACRAIFLRLAAANMLCSIPLTLLASELFVQAQAGHIDWWLTLAFVIGLSLGDDDVCLCGCYCLFFARATFVCHFAGQSDGLLAQCSAVDALRFAGDGAAQHRFSNLTTDLVAGVAAIVDQFLFILLRVLCLGTSELRTGAGRLL